MMEKADRKHGRTGDARLQWGLTEVNVTYANPDRKIDGFGNASFLGGQFMAEAKCAVAGKGWLDVDWCP